MSQREILMFPESPRDLIILSCLNEGILLAEYGKKNRETNINEYWREVRHYLKISTCLDVRTQVNSM